MDVEATALWALLELLIPGIVWALIVHQWAKLSPDNPYIFVQVVVGVGVTVALDLLVPFTPLYVFAGFALSGTPQAIGAMFRAEQRRNKPDPRDAQIAAKDAEIADLTNRLLGR